MLYLIEIGTKANPILHALPAVLVAACGCILFLRSWISISCYFVIKNTASCVDARRHHESQQLCLFFARIVAL